jgi:sucrose phosphorylase
MPDGRDVPYWNTFYQEVQYPRFDAQDLMENMDIQYLAAQRLSDMVRAGLDEGKKPSEIEFGRFEKYKIR